MLRVISITMYCMIQFLIGIYMNIKKSYKCPIILVSGELDYACIFDTGNFIEYINAPYKCNIVIKDSGHICMMENPGEFFNKINTRLKEISVLKNS